MLLGDVCLLMEGLSKQCQRACVCAVYKFKDMCDRVLSGDITMSDLNQMITHRYRVEKLCGAIEGEELSSKIVSAALDKRMQQYLFIENRRKAYTHICGWISEIEGTFDCKCMCRLTVCACVCVRFLITFSWILTPEFAN